MKDWLGILACGLLGLLVMAWFIGGMMDLAECERRGGVSVRSYYGISSTCVHGMDLGD